VTRGGALLLVAGLPLAACQAPGAPAAPKLLEKGHYQALYGPDGALERLAFDADGDRRADTVTFYSRGARPLRAEIDLDRDGTLDRWEIYDDEGRLAKVGSSRRGRPAPDLWSFADRSGGIVRQEYDDDGDGRFERAENLSGEAVVAEELDSDGDGRLDRRLVFGSDGQVAWVESDLDGDGLFERIRKAR
jgi:hypothetical protein